MTKMTIVMKMVVTKARSTTAVAKLRGMTIVLKMTMLMTKVMKVGRMTNHENPDVGWRMTGVALPPLGFMFFTPHIPLLCFVLL